MEVFSQVPTIPHHWGGGGCEAEISTVLLVHPANAQCPSLYILVSSRSRALLTRNGRRSLARLEIAAGHRFQEPVQVA